MEKNGMLGPESKSDFDNTKKAEYIDENGFHVADEANKDKLANPTRTNWCDIKDGEVTELPEGTRKPFTGPLGMF